MSQFSDGVFNQFWQYVKHSHFVLLLFASTQLNTAVACLDALRSAGHPDAIVVYALFEYAVSYS